MAEKKYPFDAIKQAVDELSTLKATEPKRLLHQEALGYMKSSILDLHKKNYDANQISALLRERGLKFAVKEIKTLIENETKNTKSTVKEAQT